MSYESYAVIPTFNRHEVLQQSVAAISSQVHKVVIVDNGSYPPVAPLFQNDVLIYVAQQPAKPPNISRLWNLGLNCVEAIARSDGVTQWDVAVLNDDAIVPDGWFDAVTIQMRAIGACAGCSDQFGHLTTSLVQREPDQNVFTRLVGYAFVLQGEKMLRADESLQWWYGDDDLDWRARQEGGMVIIPGYKINHLYPNSSTTGELAIQAGRDRETFIRKWGKAPW